MKIISRSVLALLIISISIFLTGCWNYREVDEVAIVAGVAVDKGTIDRYRLTVEVMHLEGGMDAKVISKLITAEGSSMFDAVRNIISKSGQKLYWSHAKAIIISQDIARKGVIKVIDWYIRDSETRATVNIFISGEGTADEIFSSKSFSEDLKSIELQKITENEKSISKAPIVEIWNFTNSIKSKGIEPIAPLIHIDKSAGQQLIKAEGTAIFESDKFIGSMNGEETKNILFIQNETKGGILTQIEPGKEGDCAVSLEIFKNVTKLEPVSINGNVEINIKTDTEVAIDEIGGSENFIDEDGRQKLEKDAEKTLKDRIEKTIRKVQTEYGVDIFGFGAKVRQDRPELWDIVGSNWNETFKKLKVNVSTKIKIKNSAMMSKPIEVGE